jgi:hypothetical protein
VKRALHLTVTTLSLAVSDLSAATLYVSLQSTNPMPPYSDWATAATNIQDAVRAATALDTVTVADWVYHVGQTDVGTGLTRVAVTKAITLLTVNGPQFTVIDGSGAVRCVHLADGASLTGFTLANGLADEGGGVLCSSTNAFLTNCVLTSGSATDLYSSGGGGADRGTLYDCTLTGNSASSYGGAASQCVLYDCTLAGNSADTYGGGTSECTLYNCTLTGNSAQAYGGGADRGMLYNCTLSLNTASKGGGDAGSTLFNCTLSGNSASDGGGAYGSTLYNCIVYFNTASPGGANYDASTTLNYCCTTPLPAVGTGNIALDPQLASATYLSADSPCRGAGSAAYATGTDIDGESWGNPPSMGCDEYHTGALTGPLTLSVVADYTNAAVGSLVSLTAVIGGRATASVWDFGDGAVPATRGWRQEITWWCAEPTTKACPAG